MSAAGGSGRDKTAEELLKQMLGSREQLLVLDYSKTHALESDSAVFFLVALLKLFALAYDRMLAAITQTEIARRRAEQTTSDAVRLIDGALTRRAELIRTVLDEALERMSFYTGELRTSAAEMRALKEEMEKLNKEARGTYQAYKRLADDGTGTALSQLFQKAALGALDRRVPFFDDTIRTLILGSIARETRKLMILVGAQAVVTIVLVIVFRG